MTSAKAGEHGYAPFRQLSFLTRSWQCEILHLRQGMTNDRALLQQTQLCPLSVSQFIGA